MPVSGEGIFITRNKSVPKHEKLNQCWFIVGPPSTTVHQRCPSIVFAGVALPNTLIPADD